MRSVKIKSYAKVNLTLDVLGVKDGFHLIDSVVASIDLFNLITLTKRKDNLVSGRMQGQGMDAVPFENTNACKVAEAFVEQFGCTGVDITVYENIPVGAGLGGSSADAAGVLKGLCRLYEKQLQEVYPIANRFGSDIRYMLEGGYARMEGRGEKVTPVFSKQVLNLLLLCPKSTVSAGGCYRRYDERTERFLSMSGEFLTAFSSEDLTGMGAKLSNALYPSAKDLNGDVQKAYDELLAFSPLGVTMSGSGSAVFALFETEELCRWAKSRYKGKFRSYVVKTLQSGAKEKKEFHNPFALSEEEIEKVNAGEE